MDWRDMQLESWLCSEQSGLDDLRRSLPNEIFCGSMNKPVYSMQYLEQKLNRIRDHMDWVNCPASMKERTLHLSASRCVWPEFSSTEDFQQRGFELSGRQNYFHCLLWRRWIVTDKNWCRTFVSLCLVLCIQMAFFCCFCFKIKLQTRYFNWKMKTSLRCTGIQYSREWYGDSNGAIWSSSVSGER